MKLTNTVRNTPSLNPPRPLNDTKAPAALAQEPNKARAKAPLADGFETQRPSARAAALLGAPVLPPPTALKLQGASEAAPAAEQLVGFRAGLSKNRFPPPRPAEPTADPVKVPVPGTAGPVVGDAPVTEAPAVTPPPELASAAQTALKAATVDTVTDKRAAIEGGQQEFFAQTKAEVDRLLNIGRGLEAAPPNTQVFMAQGSNEVLLAQFDETNTQVVSWTKAKLHEDGRVELHSANINGDRFEQDRILAGVDSSTVEHANWKAPEGVGVNEAPSLEELRQSRDPDVRVTENSVWHQDGNLFTKEYLQKDGAVQLSETDFTRTDNLEGIADDFHGSLQDGAVTDVARTRSYSIPPPSADGKTQPPTYTDVKSWSQGSVQVTKTDSRPLDFESEFDVGNQPHNAADLKQVVDENRDEDGEDFSGSQEYPRSWMLEKSALGEYQSQTFIEGQKEATIVLKRRAEGNKLTEEYSGKTFGTAEGDKGLVDVSGTSERTYGEDGSVMSMTSRTQNPDGSSTKQWYDRTNTPAEDGLHMLEKVGIEQTNREGQVFWTETHNDSVLSAQGMQLKSTDTYTRAPDGTQAHARMDGTGEKYFVTDPGGVTPREVTDPSQLPTDPNTQEALLQASISNAMMVQNFANKGGRNALALMQGLGQIDVGAVGRPVPYETVLAGGYKLFGNEAVNRALQGGAGIAGALGGAAGVAGNGMLLMQGIRDQNVPKIIQGAVMTGLSGYDVYKGGDAFIKAMKGISEVDISGGALKIPGWFAKVPGLATVSKSAGALKVLGAVNGGLKAIGGLGTIVGVGLGAVDVFQGIRNGNGWQVAKGTVGIAGTIAGAVATGAVAGSIGGPLGTAVGALAGVAIGLVTWGVGKLFDWFDNSEHDMAPVQI
ncbi:MAG TPA: hypothetical protein VK539_09050 [Myxococcaceae bacterium]|nr:hypothetical protein [Myxococcaceae bacterium]